jgi:hypothetical protein
LGYINYTLGKKSKFIKENDIPIRVKTIIGFINIFPIRLKLMVKEAKKINLSLFPTISIKNPKIGKRENITKN